MKKSFKASGLPIGGSSLLMAFVVLCLTTFAVISYMSALRDYRLSKKSSENITQYYMADSKAEEILSSLSSDFEKGIENADNWKENNMVFTPKDGEIEVSYEVPIREEFILQVKVRFLNDGKKFEVLCWKQVNTHIFEDTVNYLDLPIL